MKKRYLVGAVLVLVVVLAGFAFVLLKSGSDPSGSLQKAADSFPVSLEREYDEGVYTISGLITLANRCQTMEASAELQTSGVIRVNIAAPEDTGPCLMLPTEREFSLESEAPEGAGIEVYVNGALATTIAL